MNISLIAAVANNQVIGGNGKMLWHFSEDLKRFKKLTVSKVVIMGRKTYESIGKPLPKRFNIIVTKQIGYENKALGCAVSSSLEEALKAAERVAGAKIEGDDEEVFVIGGETIYKQAMQYANRIYLTKIPRDFDGDTYFPEIDTKQWKQTQCQDVMFGQYNLKCQFLILEKK